MSETSAALPLAQVPDGVPVRVDVGGHGVCVVRRGADVHAVDDLCTHAEVSLSEGELDGQTIECWLHGSRFSLTTGEPDGPPAILPLTVHRAAVHGDEVVVTLTGAGTADRTDDRTNERTAP